jgi:hydrogenase maturation factor
MHDPTEGGLANALWELAEASEVGLVVSETEIPRYWESNELAKLFDFDLLGAIASGALLIATEEKTTSSVLDHLNEAGIEANVIGRVVNRETGVNLMRGEQTIPLPRFDADEVSRVL